ncbi:MAG TPA: glycerate kinase [Mycobacteriales bacterium]|nr:glycerate kinase [Mycobacteriales bacterium]
MRVLVAPDSLGGTLTAVEAAEALAEGWRAAAPHDDVVLLPLSDGGPGFVDVLAAARPGAELRPLVVEDPLARPVPAAWLLDGATAWVESAAACGLHLLAHDERDPRRTTTYGVGQLVRAALDAGAGRVVVGLGGSATNDGGAGLLAALGVQRLDAAGQQLAPGGAALAALDRLEGDPDPRLAQVELVAATDVDAPLLGLFGASAVFGPQKGAGRDDVLALDAALTRWADALEARTRPVRDLPGAGAAGGLGAALLALGARRESGLDLVAAHTGLDDAVDGADLVLTGEGTFDMTSLRGKVVGGVCRRAAEAAVPCVVVAGQVEVGRREAAAAGVESEHALADAVGLERALERPAEALAAVAERLARQWSPARGR